MRCRKAQRLVSAHLDVNPSTLRFSPVRTGKHNSSYWVDSDKGRYVLRIAPDDDVGFLFYEQLMMRQEPDLHALIRSKTSLPVAEVVGYSFDREAIGRDYVLMAALPGTPVSDAPGITQAKFDRALRQVADHGWAGGGLELLGSLGLGLLCSILRALTLAPVSLDRSQRSAQRRERDP